MENYQILASTTAGDLVQALLNSNFKEHKSLRHILYEINNSQNNNSVYAYNYYENLIPKDGIYLFEQDGNLSKLTELFLFLFEYHQKTQY